MSGDSNGAVEDCGESAEVAPEADYLEVLVSEESFLLFQCLAVVQLVASVVLIGYAAVEDIHWMRLGGIALIVTAIVTVAVGYRRWAGADRETHR